MGEADGVPHLAAAERSCVSGSEVVYPFEGVGTLSGNSARLAVGAKVSAFLSELDGVHRFIRLLAMRSFK